MAKSPTHWAVLALVVNAFMWGVSWWPFRQAEGLGLHPLWATGLVCSVALCAVLLRQPATLHHFRHCQQLWWLALAAGLTNVGFTWAVTIGDVVRVVLLFYLMPAWVVLLAWPLLGEKPRLSAIIRLALALMGVSFILHTPETAWPVPESLADWLALGAGFFFALNNILLRQLHAVPGAASMAAMFGGGAVVAWGAGLLAWGSGMIGPLPAIDWSWLGWVALLSAMILWGNFCLQYGAVRLQASTTSIIMLSEILFATASAVWAGAGHISQRTLLGGLCIVLAAALSARSDNSPPP